MRLSLRRVRGLALAKPEKFESSSGIGVRGVVDGKRMAIGNTALMDEEQVDRNHCGMRRSGCAMKARVRCSSQSTAVWPACSPCLTRSRRRHRSADHAA